LAVSRSCWSPLGQRQGEAEYRAAGGPIFGPDPSTISLNNRARNVPLSQRQQSLFEQPGSQQTEHPMSGTLEINSSLEILWWKEPTKDQWLAWIAAWLGWTLCR
jgi:hypothetical protein